MSETIPMPRACTFEADDWQILARHWYPVAIAATLGDGPGKFTLLDEQLVIYRVNGAWVVAKDVCPHRGVPLSLGSNPDGQGVVCPYHGLRYGAGGRCDRIPAHPHNGIPSKFTLATFPAVERYGLVWTCLNPGAAPRIPVMPHWDDGGFQHINVPRFDVNGFAGRQVEGFIDVAHFAFVHSATFADPAKPEVPDYRPKLTDYGFMADYRSSIGNYPIGVAGRAPEGFEWLRHFEVTVPFTATLTIHFPGDDRLVIMNAASPVSARQTALFAPICRNFDTHLPVRDVHDFNLRVFEEDRAMVESQRPENLPLDPALEAHIPADRSSIAYRRALRGLGLSQFFLA